MRAKLIFAGVAVGVLAYMVSRATQAAAVDTAQGDGSGISAAADGFINAAYSVGNFGGGNMEISLMGLALIKREEGYRALPYRDQAGLWTGGYGHKLGALEGKQERSEAEWSAILARDVAAAENAVNSAVTVNLTQNQFDALVSFVYNVGAGAFRRSTLLAKVNAGDVTAQDEFGRWVFVTSGGRKTVSSGLANRRGMEAAMFRGDTVA